MSETIRARSAAPWRPRATTALVLLWLTSALGWVWPWGVLFLASTWTTVRIGETTLVEPVSRGANPLLFFLITATWMLLSASLIGWDLARWFAPGYLVFLGAP